MEAWRVGEQTLVGQFFMKKGADLKLLRALQSIHDEEPIKRWEEHFATLCEDWNIPYPEESSTTSAKKTSFSLALA